MDRWRDRVAVVTGASSGIGEAIARDLVEAGLRVVAVARRKDRLEQNKGKLSPDLQSRFYIRQCDVSSEDEVQAMFDWIEETLGGTDILVNNAAVLKIGNLVEMEARSVQGILNTNVMGLIYCTQAAVKSMRRRDFSGHIVNLNSIAGHHVPPDFKFNIYPATKFAVGALNETIRHEMRRLGTNIKTTSISPGLVQTEIAPKDYMDIMGSCSLSPEDVSQAILFAISTPPHVQIQEITIKPVGEAC